MKKNSFIIEVAQTKEPSAQTFFFDKNIQLKLNDTCEHHIRFKKTLHGFSIFSGESVSDFEPYKLPGAGTIIDYNRDTNELLVTCDRLGTSIIFWCKKGNSVLLSNRIDNLAGFETDPDWSSIQQYLHTGYTTTNRTFYKEIFQTRPNINLKTSTTKPEIKINERPTNIVRLSDSSQHLDHQISEQLLHCLNSTQQSVLMMSAGWDSRTLLLGGNESIKACYSHGDLGSREIAISRELSGIRRLDHHFVDVENCELDSTIVDRMLTDLGFGIFPIWFIAAQNINNWDPAPLMSGVLGEMLGGHYGIMALGSRLQKIASSVSLFNGSFVKEHQILAAVTRLARPPSTHWFVSGIGQLMLDTYRDETEGRTLEAIHQQKEISGSWQRTLEDFNMEHRARQYILKQAQAACTTVGYTIPFANETLSDMVRALDFNTRVHNKTNRAILKKRAPELLRESMAATLVPAYYPILIQELSRALRISSELLANVLKNTKPRLGWFNYQHLYEGDTLNGMIDSLKGDLWDKDKMHNSLKTNPSNNIDAGSTLDMLCKLKTVDYHLGIIHANST